MGGERTQRALKSRHRSKAAKSTTKQEAKLHHQFYSPPTAKFPANRASKALLKLRWNRKWKCFATSCWPHRRDFLCPSCCDRLYHDCRSAHTHTGPKLYAHAAAWSTARSANEEEAATACSHRCAKTAEIAGGAKAGVHRRLLFQRRNISKLQALIANHEIERDYRSHKNLQRLFAAAINVSIRR